MKNLRTLSIIAVAFALLSNSAWSQNASQPLQAGRQSVQLLTVGSKTTGFLCYLPFGYDANPGKKWPLIIAHECGGGDPGLAYLFAGGFSGHCANLAAQLETPEKYRYYSDSFVVVTLWLGQDYNGCHGPSVDAAYKALYTALFSQLYSTVRIDQARIHLIGFCYGADNVIRIGQLFPDVPASISAWQVNDPTNGCTDTSRLYLLKDIPINIIHGKNDLVNIWQRAYLIYQTLLDIGNTNAHWYLSSAPHESWLWNEYNAVDTSSMQFDWYGWMLQQIKHISGIAYGTRIETPSSASNGQSTSVRFSVDVSSSSTITGVSIDLSKIGGADSVAMTHGAGTVWELNYTIPAGITPGAKVLNVNARDNQGDYKSTVINFTITDANQPVLVSKGKTATASSSQDGNVAPAYAVDGVMTSRWGSLSSDPQWIRVDLGSTMPVYKAVLTWESAFGKAYSIQVSTDGTTWQTAWSTTTGDGGKDEITFDPVNARYVRMYGTQRGTAWGYSLYEFEIYSPAQTSAAHQKNIQPSTISNLKVLPGGLAVSVGDNESWDFSLYACTGKRINHQTGLGSTVISFDHNLSAAKGQFIALLKTKSASIKSLIVK